MAKAKFDIRTEATKGLYAGAGVADLAVDAVKEYVADVQKRLASAQHDVTTRVSDVRKTVVSIEPRTIPTKASGVVNTRVEAVAADAKARRSAVEARLAELQNTAKVFPGILQTIVNQNVATANSTYTELAKRGEVIVKKLRGELADGIEDAADAVEDAMEDVADVVKVEGAKTPSTTKNAPSTKKAPAEPTSAAKKSPTAKKSPAAKKTPATKKSPTPRKTTARKTATAKADTPTPSSTPTDSGTPSSSND